MPSLVHLAKRYTIVSKRGIQLYQKEVALGNVYI